MGSPVVSPGAHWDIKHKRTVTLTLTFYPETIIVIDNVTAIAAFFIVDGISLSKDG